MPAAVHGRPGFQVRVSSSCWHWQQRQDCQRGVAALRCAMSLGDDHTSDSGAGVGSAPHRNDRALRLPVPAFPPIGGGGVGTSQVSPAAGSPGNAARVSAETAGAKGDESNSMCSSARHPRVRTGWSNKSSAPAETATLRPPEELHPKSSRTVELLGYDKKVVEELHFKMQALPAKFSMGSDARAASTSLPPPPPPPPQRERRPTDGEQGRSRKRLERMGACETLVVLLARPFEAETDYDDVVASLHYLGFAARVIVAPSDSWDFASQSSLCHLDDESRDLHRSLRRQAMSLSRGGEDQHLDQLAQQQRVARSLYPLLNAVERSLLDICALYPSNSIALVGVGEAGWVLHAFLQSRGAMWQWLRPKWNLVSLSSERTALATQAPAAAGTRTTTVDVDAGPQDITSDAESSEHDGANRQAEPTLLDCLSEDIEAAYPQRSPWVKYLHVHASSSLRYSDAGLDSDASEQDEQLAADDAVDEEPSGTPDAAGNDVDHAGKTPDHPKAGGAPGRADVAVDYESLESCFTVDGTGGDDPGGMGVVEECFVRLAPPLDESATTSPAAVDHGEGRPMVAESDPEVDPGADGGEFRAEWTRPASMIHWVPRLHGRGLRR